MSEYFNFGGLSIVVIINMAVFILNAFTKESSPFIYFLLLLMYGSLFFDANDKYKAADENMRLFQAGITLKCFGGGGIYSSANYFKVSIEDGWELDKKYFIKDSLMISVEKCEKI